MFYAKLCKTVKHYVKVSKCWLHQSLSHILAYKEKVLFLIGNIISNNEQVFMSKISPHDKSDQFYSDTH